MAHFGGYSDAKEAEALKVTDANVAVGELVKYLQQNLQATCGISVDEVVKGGSLGHGTAVPGNFDIDLVLYSRSISAVEVEHSGYTRWLTSLNEFLQSAESLKDRVQGVTQDEYLVKFTYNGNIEVDLLVSPFWDSQHQLYDFLSRVPQAKIKNFSVNASKWQVHFFQHQPNQVKELIKRAKAWRNKMWPTKMGGTGRPKSYMLSVLVLSAYKEASHKVGTSNTERIARQTTKELQEMVRSHHKLDVYWEEYYKRRDYPNLLPSRPRIIDPANPTNNLYVTGITKYRPKDRAHNPDGNWTQFIANINSIDLTKTVWEIQEM